MAAKRQASTVKTREAGRTRDELSAALESVGIVLPSLRVDPLTVHAERPLIDLGRCNIQTAHQLIAALRLTGGQTGAGQ